MVSNDGYILNKIGKAGKKIDLKSTIGSSLAFCDVSYNTFCLPAHDYQAVSYRTSFVTIFSSMFLFLLHDQQPELATSKDPIYASN